jgi:hypothetical protein
MLVETRNALHQLARFVLAADLDGTTELVTLRITPGGFGQPERLIDGQQRRVRVDGTTIVVQHGEHEVWTPLTTLDAAAAAVGVALSAEATASDRPLPIDPVDAALLARFFASTDAALAELRRRHIPDRPTIAQLFPHHFDLAITMREVNVGGSPGDADHDEPYLYVGPWTLAPHPMWNETWGASRPWTDQTTLDEILQFFEDGLTAARRSRE